MKIYKFSIWKFLSFISFILILIIIRSYILEYQKNLPYKKDLEFIEKNLMKTKEEAVNLQKQILLLEHPLTLEKEKKDKFGEALEGEKIILVSEELLENTSLPIFQKQNTD